MQTMKVKPPSDLHLQCETCGVPVHAIEAKRFENGHAVGVVDPCGHEMRFPVTTP